jgi:hypothetical protein
MIDLRFTLTTDGPSDRVLVHHLSWVLRRQLGNQVALQPQWADFRALPNKPRNLAERIQVAIDLYSSDLLFIHRDAEGPDPSSRYGEIEKAVAEANVQVACIPVVPIRMTEAWLMFDERAVRRAAGNPNGNTAIDWPVRSPDRIVDPKAVLHEALRAASGLGGRRLRSFNTAQAVYRIAECIDDFSPLHELQAFAELERRIAQVLPTLGQ